MLRYVGYAGFVCLGLICGCGKPTNAWGVATHSSSGTQNGVDFSYSVETITRQGKPHLIMVFNGGAGTNLSTNRHGGEGKVLLNDGTKLSWTYQTSDVKIGEVVIAGRAFPADQGSLFLIDATEKPPQIEQLAVDLSDVGLKTVLDDLAAMKSTHPKVAQFIARFRGNLAETGESLTNQTTEGEDRSTR